MKCGLVVTNEIGKLFYNIIIVKFLLSNFIFSESYNADGGDCTVVYLPDEGITGNSHFMFQEMNNDVIADHIAAWLESKGLN